jgi:hypothetical protein
VRYGGRRLCTKRIPARISVMIHLLVLCRGAGSWVETDVEVDIERFHIYLSMRSQSNAVNTQQGLDIIMPRQLYTSSPIRIGGIPSETNEPNPQSLSPW